MGESHGLVIPRLLKRRILVSLAIRISPLFTVFNREYDKSFDSFLPLSNKVVKDVLIEGYKTNSRMATPPMLDEGSFHHNVLLKKL